MSYQKEATRLDCIETMREINSLAESESRELTADEQKRWNEAQKAIRQLDIEIADWRSSNPGAMPGREDSDPGSTSREFTGERWIDRRSGREVAVLAPGDSWRSTMPRDHAAERHYQGLSFGGFARAMLMGPQSEAERRALAEGTDSAGGFTVPEILLPGFIDRLRAATTVIRAGARTVPLETNKTDMARLATDPTVSWHTENASISDNSPTFEQVQFDALTAVSLIRVSRELVQDSINIETMLEQAFRNSMAVEIDRVCLQGASGSGEPVGVDNITGVGTVAFGGGTLANFDPILDGVHEIIGDSAPMPTAAIMHPFHSVAFAKLKDTTDQPLQRPAMADELQWLSTTGIAETGASPIERRIYLGHFPHMMIGMRSEVRVEVLRERYADNFQFGFLAHMRLDVQVEHAQSFAYIDRVAAS